MCPWHNVVLESLNALKYPPLVTEFCMLSERYAERSMGRFNWGEFPAVLVSLSDS
jgi:hypothetical protein